MSKSKLSDIYRGDTLRYKISIPGVDLSNDTFYIGCKENPTDADPGVFQAIIAPVHNKPGDDPTNGIVYAVASATDTANMVPGKKYWIGVQWVNSASEVRTLIVAQVKCLQDINITS